MDKNIDLKDTTFIIPIAIDTTDREFNFKYVIQYLCNNLDTNIIIKESSKEQRINELLKCIDLKNTKITHLYEKTKFDVFHRTRILNEMLMQVNTSIVVNYDIDILLLPDTYLQAANKIRDEKYDLIYPYFLGWSQLQIHNSIRNILHTKPLEQFIKPDFKLHESNCGFCQFFNTESYIKGGMENEHFISWGAEDFERKLRFQKLEYKVEWLNNYVYHIEHSRGKNSGATNPFFKDNDILFDKLRNMNKQQITEYYNNIDYLKKYYKK